ncbi:hypothetical protein O181_088681 [Austropuccinia psidii MF-1]|uniref:Uncharacterized protein n=1 Tax=Austropuccinia psidii MF-1 TaxID=1389203 RepID=A0A9Q3IS00_9BASI|nr:hypothetical protein [Austropuccinia psidii MF-1]
MSVLTHSKKSEDNDAAAKPLSNKEVYSMLDSLKSEVLSLKSACSSDAAEIHFLRMALLSPLFPAPSFQHISQSITSAYDHTVLLTVSTSSKFPKWVASLNWVRFIAFNSKMSINDSPSLLDGQSPQENCVISHFIYA